MSAQSDAAIRAYLHGDEPEAGNPFEITVRTRIQHPMRTVTVYAYDLPEALHKAAALPLSVWWDDGEEGES